MARRPLLTDEERQLLFGVPSKRRYVAGTRNVARLMRMFHDTIEALGTAQNSERDAFTVVDETVGWASLLRVQGEVRELADLAGEDPLQGAADRYLTLRKFAPELIEALEFKAARPHDSTLITQGVGLAFRPASSRHLR